MSVELKVRDEKDKERETIVLTKEEYEYIRYAITEAAPGPDDDEVLSSLEKKFNLKSN